MESALVTSDMMRTNARRRRGLWYTGGMRIEITIDIAAAPTDVWPIIRDVTKWSEWTESINSVELLDGPSFEVGTRAKVRQPGFPAAVWTVTELTEGRSFTWVSKTPGLRSTGIHTVTVGPRGSIATLGIVQEGLLAWPMKVVFGRKSERFVRMEADGLRRRAESRAT